MTSKISFIKLLRETVRQRAWLAALTGTVLFFLIPVNITLQLASSTDASESFTLTDTWIYRTYPGFLNGGTFWPLLAVIFLAGLLCSFSGFIHIHSREKLDFYHSFPVKREKWFAAAYTGGFLIFIVPYLICCAMALISGLIYKIMDPALAVRCAGAAVSGILAFFIIYNICTIAAALTGQTVTGFLAALTLSVYPYIVFTLIPVMSSSFFDSYCTTKPLLTARLAELTSPLALAASLPMRYEYIPFQSHICAALIMILITLAAALALYRIYPSEAAGNALAFPVTAPLIKILVCIPTSIFISSFFRSFTGADGTVWIIILSLLFAVLLCLLTEFIFCQDLRLVFKRGWKSSGIIIVCVIFVLCIFQFDLFGYDSRQPSEDKVVSMSFTPDSYSSYFTYPDYELKRIFAPEECTGDIYLLAGSGINNLKKGITPQLVWQLDPGSEYINCVFEYKMESGKIISRQYPIERTEVLDNIENLCKNEAYRKLLFPVFYIDRSAVTNIYLSDIYENENNLILTEEQKDSLLDAYEKDLLKADIRIFENQIPIGTLNVASIINDNYDGITAVNNFRSSDIMQSVSELYLYDSFSETLNLLNGFGYRIRTEISPDDVSFATFFLDAEDVESGIFDELIHSLSKAEEYAQYTSEQYESEGISVDSKEDIKLLLSHTERNYNSLLYHNSKNSSISIYFNDRTGLPYNYSLIP